MACCEKEFLDYFWLMFCNDQQNYLKLTCIIPKMVRHSLKTLQHLKLETKENLAWLLFPIKSVFKEIFFDMFTNTNINKVKISEKCSL